MNRTTLLTWLILITLGAFTTSADSAEVLFTRGPQRFAGQNYYWLAEWKLEITFPSDVGPQDRFEVLFGSKGPGKRTLYFDYSGTHRSMADVRAQAFEWIPLPLERLEPGKKVVLYGKGHDRVAFLAGVRVVGKSTAPLKIKPIPTYTGVRSGDGAVVWSELPGFELNDDTRKLWDPAPTKPDWQRAARSARFAGIALSKVQRWLHERCLAVHDKPTGLFRPTGRIWTYWDTAADCYPFYVWAAYYTDQHLLDTVMLDTLAAEQRLCNHLDRLPVSYDMDTKQKVVVPFDRIIFGASEYAKDGLTPIVEITGRSYPWFNRMRGLVDDIFKNAKIDTPYGKIPSKNIEVNGEMLQTLVRLYSMTGAQKYLDWAHRLADYYLLPGKFVPSRLSDHGCEIIGGLGLLFAVDTDACPEKCKQYKPHLEYMFDEILRRGTNSDGIIVGTLQPTAGPHDDVITRDGWGYDLVGFLDYDLALGTSRYTAAIRRPMANLLKPRYKKYSWNDGSRDNLADSVEGGLYLAYRFPTPATFIWADREIATILVDHTKPDRLWDTHKLEANTVRTVLIHTMLHTRNTIARPWQQGLELGAAPCGDGICVFMKSATAYAGRVQFDIPRHRLFMGFKQDWPRMNAVPEWFTVEPDDAHTYQVIDADTGQARVLTGRSLHQGLSVNVQPNRPLRLIVQPQKADSH